MLCDESFSHVHHWRQELSLNLVNVLILEDELSTLTLTISEMNCYDILMPTYCVHTHSCLVTGIAPSASLKLEPNELSGAC